MQGLEDVFYGLLDAGVELVFALQGDSLPDAISTEQAVATVDLPLARSGPEADGVQILRAAADLARFLAPQNGAGERPRQRAVDRLLQLAAIPDGSTVRTVIERLPPSVAVKLDRGLRELERILPPPTELERDIAELGIDGMLLLPESSPGGFELDAIKVARRLGLPSIMLLADRTSLAAGAALNEDPDRLIVLADGQVRQAVEWQGIPRERVVALGGLDEPAAPAVAAEISRCLRWSVTPPPDPSSPPPRLEDGPSPRMLVVAPAGLFGTISDVLAELLDSGLELLFSGRKLKSLRVPEELLSHPSASIIELPLHRGGDCDLAVATLRTASDLTRFLNPDLAEEGLESRVRIARRLLKLLGADYATLAPQTADMLLPHEAHHRLAAAFDQLERLIPPPEELESAIGELAVRGVLMVTRCTVGGFEPDILKVAHRLDLPSVMVVSSWDNLTSKAIIREHPDRLIVWNATQVREAVEHHGIPADRVLALGAPSFDRFFDELEQQAPWAPRRPGGILYLGSSPDVAADELSIFDRWLQALRSSGDPLLEDIEVIVRPHPGAGKWGGWSPADERVRFLVPREKREPETLAQLLVSADAVVGLNTSAELEAAVAGRPVLTFRAGRDAPGQEGTVHFRYLLRDNGGFVIDAATLQDHVARLGQVLRGEDDAAETQQDFVERFLRPAGLSQAVSPVVASTILGLVLPQPASVSRQ